MKYILVLFMRLSSTDREDRSRRPSSANDFKILMSAGELFCHPNLHKADEVLSAAPWTRDIRFNDVHESEINTFSSKLGYNLQIC